MIKNNFIKERILKSKMPYIIAEIGINHNGDISLAKKMIKSAKINGAHCVKFQKFIADDYISKYAQKANYQKNDRKVKKKTQLEIIRDCQLNTTQLKILKRYSKKLNIDFLCTPFEVQSLKDLVKIGIKAIKISSCNLTNIPFLKEVAKTNLPVLLSTGMANFAEIKEAFNIFKKNKNPIIVFQCTSNYPANSDNANIAVIKNFKKTFKCPIGYSDHTENNIPAILAVSYGAVVIEKHFTLSKKLPGIDQKASIEPHELKKLVEETYQAKKSIGISKKVRSKEEINTMNSLRRSLVAGESLKKGTKLKKNMIKIKRPGIGLSTKNINKIIGLTLKKNIKKDQLFKLGDFK